MTADEISLFHQIYSNKEKFKAVSEIDADGQQLMYISLIENIRSSLTYLYVFQLLVLLP